jgi:hypothetical protein
MKPSCNFQFIAGNGLGDWQSSMLSAKQSMCGKDVDLTVLQDRETEDFKMGLVERL